MKIVGRGRSTLIRFGIRIYRSDGTLNVRFISPDARQSAKCFVDALELQKRLPIKETELIMQEDVERNDKFAFIYRAKFRV